MPVFTKQKEETKTLSGSQASPARMHRGCPRLPSCPLWSCLAPRSWCLKLDIKRRKSGVEACREACLKWDLEGGERERRHWERESESQDRRTRLWAWLTSKLTMHVSPERKREGSSPSSALGRITRSSHRECHKAFAHSGSAWIQEGKRTRNSLDMPGICLVHRRNHVIYSPT